MNEITIYSDIGENWMGDGITDQYIKDQITDMEGDITVRINSGGGDVFHGFAIYNLLKQHESKIIVKIDGLAASAASVIAMAGDEIHMGEASMLMIHNPWTMALGEAKDLIKTAGLLEKIKDSIIDVYSANTGSGKQDISAMMDEETWLTAEESVAQGFASKTVSGGAVKNANRKWFKNAPKPTETIIDTVVEPVIEQKKPLLKIAAKARLLSI